MNKAFAAPNEANGQKRENAKKSGFRKQNGFQIVTSPNVRFNIVCAVCAALLRFAYQGLTR
ncbi:hypothetical protein DWV24_04875 [Bacteroides thetaiotaomicron]|jgi:hypothetical protein|nr:hypothetical protein DWV24_04875 [Bacteroides thetaiotaomicron]